MAAQRFARREPHRGPDSALRSLTRGRPLPAERALIRTLCGTLNVALSGLGLVCHSGSLGLGAAVANARRTGRLPAADSPGLPHELRLYPLLTDLQRLRARLGAARATGVSRDRASFSRELVGPDLWSLFLGLPGCLAAEYHVDCSLESRPAVLTHRAVIRATLTGN